MLCYITRVILCYITCVLLCYITKTMFCYIITCHFMLYNICQVMLYIICHVTLYNKSHVMLYMVCLSNRPHFLWVYRRDNPRGMLGEHEKKLVNHEPKASDLQAFNNF